MRAITDNLKLIEFTNVNKYIDLPLYLRKESIHAYGSYAKILNPHIFAESPESDYLVESLRELLFTVFPEINTTPATISVSEDIYDYTKALRKTFPLVSIRFASDKEKNDIIITNM
jgi:hypothetical protein